MGSDPRTPLEVFRNATTERLKRAQETAWYTLAVEERPGYLHVIVTGQNSKEAVFSYLEELVSLCETRNCYRVLVEERLVGPRLSLADVLEVVNGAQPGAAGRYPTIAYVDVYAEGPMMEYAEAAGAMRGIDVRLFKSVDEAKRWLGDR